jgi:hypothetical protein
LNEDAIGCKEAGEDSMGRMAKAYSVNLLFSEGIFSESDCGRDTVKLETEKLSHDGSGKPLATEMQGGETRASASVESINAQPNARPA